MQSRALKKNDKVEKVVTDGPNVVKGDVNGRGKLGNIGKVVEKVALIGVQLEERLCKSIMKRPHKTQSRETSDAGGDGRRKSRWRHVRPTT